ncbi:MAG: threonine synthase [Micromonosporaceae bacterium]|jgi:threonine synthase
MTIALPVSSPARALVCRGCGAEHPLGPDHACHHCLGPLEVGYDPDALRAVTREQIASGPPNLWRYAPLLPVGQDPAQRVSLDPGFTPLVPAPALAAEVGVRGPLWVKDDSANPTHSFKDRVVSVALTAARAMGFTRYACASTGNLANSVAAHAARAGAESMVFIPADLEAAKVVTTAVYGGALVAVDGTYDDVNRLCGELVESDELGDTAFVNVNLRPFYAEGSRTLAFEVAEQLGWRIPAQVVVPMASGELLTKVDKGFSDLVEAGLAEPPAGGWRVFGAQSAGCQPIVAAFHAGADEVTPVRPTGIARSLNIGDPAAGRYALAAVRRTGGWMESADDDEIREGIRLLARTTGIFTETAGGVTVAVLRKLVASGRLDPDAETVVLNTGEGLKTPDAVAHTVGPTHRVRPSLRSAREAGLLG